MSGADVTDQTTTIDQISACGGVVFALGADPDNFQAGPDTATDCVTGLHLHFPDAGVQALGSPSGAYSITTSVDFWRDQFAAAPGTQWQTHIPTVGYKMGLLSGSPVALNGSGQVFPLGAGTSFYIYTQALTAADLIHRPAFIASANSDNALEYRMRHTDNNNTIIFRYTEATQTWTLTEVVAGVPNLLASTIVDLTSAPAGMFFRIDVIGTTITFVSDPIGIGGPFTTAVLAPGKTAYFFDANGAGASGFTSQNQFSPP